MRRASLAIAAFAALTTAILLSPAPAAAAVDFRTPKKAAYCHLTAKGTIGEGDQPTPRDVLDCWTPNDGFQVFMFKWGYARHENLGRLEDYKPRARRILRYGQRWKRPGFVCISRRSGLTCKNRRKHGWWLGVFVGYRMF